MPTPELVQPKSLKISPLNSWTSLHSLDQSFCKEPRFDEGTPSHHDRVHTMSRTLVRWVPRSHHLTYVLVKFGMLRQMSKNSWRCCNRSSMSTAIRGNDLSILYASFRSFHPTTRFHQATMLFDFFPVHGIATSCHFDKWWSAKTRGPHGKSEENLINLKTTRMWWAEPPLISWISWISWISHSKMYVRFQTMTI